MGANRKLPTMTDVARLAGVSQSTVSLVLRGKAGDNIPEATRDRIFQASSELGYRVSAFQIMPKLFYPFLLFVSSMIFIFLIPSKKES